MPMTEKQRAALATEAAIAQFLLAVGTLYPEERRALEQALAITRREATS